MNSMGIDKAIEKTRIVVAMSGGVDSSVTAVMLHEEGYEVIGITMQLYDHGKATNKKGACCAGRDIYDAKRIAEEYGFKHYVLNYESKFQDSVINDFVDSYLKGETPIPCIRCNQTVKFNDLLKMAKDLDADAMATGHYIRRIVNDMGIAELHEAVADDGKDQSYFLFATTQEQLDFLRFPLGGMPKSKTREKAKKLGLCVADKPDSQDICFVPEGGYADIVKKMRPHAVKSGNIVHIDGRIIGTHKGVIYYTIGQRRGLGIGGGVIENNEPIYVTDIDANKNEVIVGPYAALAKDIVYIDDCNWLVDMPVNNIEVEVKLRSTQKKAKAKLFQNNKETYVILDEPQFGIATGQACVCYIGTRIIGGGWIKKTKKK